MMIGQSARVPVMQSVYRPARRRIWFRFLQQWNNISFKALVPAIQLFAEVIPIRNHRKLFGLTAAESQVLHTVFRFAIHWNFTDALIIQFAVFLGDRMIGEIECEFFVFGTGQHHPTADEQECLERRVCLGQMLQSCTFHSTQCALINKLLIVIE